MKMASSIAEERELITARLQELDDVEKRMDQVLDEKEKKKEVFAEKKIKLEEQKRKVNQCTSKLDRKLTAMKEVNLTKDLQWKKTLEEFGVRKTELKTKITEFEEKIDEIEKKSTPLKIPDNSECPVCQCQDKMFPPEKIFQCKEGHIVCHSCLQKLTLPKICPTCRCVGPYSRNRTLEDLHTRVAEEAKVSQKERRQVRMLADEQIGTLIDKMEALNKQLEDFRVLEEHIYKEKAACAEEISATTREMSTLKEKESGISEDIRNLEWECSLMEKDYDRRIREERENNQLVALNDMKRDKEVELKSVVLGYQHITKHLERDVIVRQKYVWATHVVIFHVEIDGDKIPPIQIFMTGEDSPRTVEKFLKLCNSDYKGSRIYQTNYSIQGGIFHNYEVSPDSQPVATFPQRVLEGDVVMCDTAEAEEEYSDFDILLNPVWCYDIVVVGKVLDMAPGSGVEQILKKAMHEIIIRDITILPLSKPVIINEYKED